MENNLIVPRPHRKPKILATYREGCDLTVRRLEKRRPATLELRVSERSYRLVDGRNGKAVELDPRDAESARLVESFFRNTPGIGAGTLRGSWLFLYEPCREHAAALMATLEALESDPLHAMFTDGYGVFYGRPAESNEVLSEAMRLYGGHRELYGHVFEIIEGKTGAPLQETLALDRFVLPAGGNGKWRNLLHSAARLAEWESRFPDGSAFELVDRWAETEHASLFESYCISIGGLLDEADNPRRMIDYLLRMQEEEGYGDKFEDAIEALVDSRRCQRAVYGEVECKYPENLASYHRKIAYAERHRRRKNAT